MHQYRPTWAEVSLKSIKHNVHQFINHMENDCILMAVVKADAYGHGLVESANQMLKSGADRLGVAIVEEAIQLRNAGFRAPILVFGFTPKEAVQEAIEKHIILTIFTEDLLEEIIQVAESNKTRVKVHLKIDSGTHRIGIKKKMFYIYYINTVSLM